MLSSKLRRSDRSRGAVDTSYGTAEKRSLAMALCPATPMPICTCRHLSIWKQRYVACVHDSFGQSSRHAGVPRKLSSVTSTALHVMSRSALLAAPAPCEAVRGISENEGTCEKVSCFRADVDILTWVSRLRVATVPSTLMLTVRQ